MNNVRIARPLFHSAGSGSIPTSALQLVFDTCDRETFQNLNRLWHSTLPKISVRVGVIQCYSAEFDGLFYATAMWGNPVARNLPQHECMELRRFAIASDRPKNTASRMLGWMVRDIRKRFSFVNRLVSYQDKNSHLGTIYKAAGWVAVAECRAKGWEGGSGGAAYRHGRKDQAVAERIRWEKAL